MSVYYNENDPYPAQWLRNLIAAGYLPKGDVDERSIQDVTVHDVAGYTQCHFFAGIGGWPLALQLAGWPDEKEVWTGSCPCQPFSVAGQQKGFKDDRHLWPVWFDLIEQYHPATIFGEQVAGAIKWGWLDLVFSDLEAEGYACGATVLPACGVGAPHIRQRLWFVADADGRDASAEGLQRGGEQRQQQEDGRVTGGLAYPASEQMGVPGQSRQLGDADDSRSQGRCIDLGEHAGQRATRQASQFGFMADTGYQQAGWSSRSRETKAGRSFSDVAGCNPWSNLVWLPCTDGKERPTQPGIFPLAHGVSARVGKLRAAGNAIVPQVAAGFIRAVMS